MKRETLIRLLAELEKKDYSINGKNSIEDLFRVYTETEITCLDDIFNNNVKDFKAFVFQNLNKFNGIDMDEEGEISSKDNMLLHSLMRNILAKFSLYNHGFFSDFKENQEKFVSNVEKVIGNTKPNILDVGSGDIPYSSILLAQDNAGEISTMDKFILSKKSIEKMNCFPISKYFDYDTDIGYYDFVVANRACSAIEPIVYRCVTQKKPYLIRLCECNAPDDTIDSWHDRLREMDRNIKFDDKSYAYDLDL